MDVNHVITHTGKCHALPGVARFVHVLLVVHDTNSLISLASQFKQQLCQVTTAVSATIALALLETHPNYYDFVIADIHMPEMSIPEFVKKLHGQCMSIPIILISKDLAMDSTRKALDQGVCYVLSKPPSCRDIATVWQHIHRVTGEMPALFDKTNYDINTKKYDNLAISDSSDRGPAGNENRKNMEMKMINTEKENLKRKKKQIVKTSNSSTDTHEDDGRYSKKSHIT